MAGKVTKASEQVHAWLEQYKERIKSNESEAVVLDVALEAIKRDVPNNPVVQALSRDGLRMRAARLSIQFRPKGERRIPDANKALNDWLKANCANHSLKSAVVAIEAELGHKVRPNVLEMRKKSLGLTFGKSGSGARPASDWIAEAIVRSFGAKRPPADIESLAKRVIADLPEDMAGKANEITHECLLLEINALYWEAGKREELFRTAVKAERTAEELYGLFKERWDDEAPLPPPWVVREKMRDMHGRSSAPRVVAETIPGILRVPISEAKSHLVAETSFETPFHGLPKSPNKRLKVGVISSPEMGLPYDPDIVRNLLRSGFSAARKLGCDVIVVGGGLFRLSWQKTAGPARLLADFVTDIDSDPESVDKAYRAEMREIIESGRFEPVFTTALERFNNLLRGWYKILLRPGERPEFGGPIYIVLNTDDLSIVWRMAYFEILWHQHKRMLEAQEYARGLTKYAAQVYKHGTPQAYAKADADAKEAARLASRFRMTNLDPTQDRRIFEQTLNYFIERVEESIPGAKVIGLNAAYLRLAGSDKILKFVSGGDSRNPHYGELGNYGPAQREGELPALTVSMHPRAAWMRKTAREDYRNGSMLEYPNGAFVEAPILVDPGPIKERTRGMRIPLPVMKAVGDSMFAPGMLLVMMDPVLGINPDVVPAEAVRKLGAPQANGPHPPPKRMWWVVSTDMHFGAANRLFVRRSSGIRMGLTEAGFELMKRDGLSASGAAPVVGFIAADDLTQGNHFDTHVRPHHNRRTNVAVLDELDARLKAITRLKGRTAREKELRTMLVETADQIVVRTPDHLGSQLDEMRQGFLIPYRSIFSGVLIAAKEAGVSVKGISRFTGARFDSRDVGLINFGSGNHATKTTNGMLYEGIEVAAFLRESLREARGLAGFDLSSLVRAPLFQDRSIGYGRIRAHGDAGYEWGLHVTGTPPKRDSWLDVLHGWVEANRHLGNPSGILDGIATLHVTGDKHFFASAFAGGDLYVMGSSSTHTDAFAYIAGGLPENNAGLVFIGLPVDGPDAAEISVVHMQPKLIQDFILSGERFPWEEFLPHRA